MGISPIGNNETTSIEDGHKFACGLHAIRGSPVVYSFGSNQRQDFELGILELRPDAKIFVFEILEEQLPRYRDPRIHYHALGLGNGPMKIGNQLFTNIRTLKEHMISLGHAYIDVLKMDIEGGEFGWMAGEGAELLPRVGQLLVEVHVRMYVPGDPSYPRMKRFGDILDLWKRIESTGQRLFFQEINWLSMAVSVGYCTELAFVQGSWSVWDTKKFNLKHLI